MATIAQEIAQLQLNTNNLATTLQEKGVPCNASDGLGSLVTKVAEIPEAVASDRIAYQVATIGERDAITDAQTGDLCLVAGQSERGSSFIDYNWLGNTIYIPKHIELTDEQWELFEEYGYISTTWLRLSDSATATYMYVSPRIYSPDYGSNCLIYIYDRIDYYENGGTNKTGQIRFYNNMDGTYDYQTKSIPTGAHFTVEEDSEGFTITFDREMKCYLNNADYNELLSLFINGGASVSSTFDGIFEYDGTNWNYANLNLSATAADVSNGVDFYSNNGLSTGVFLAEETILGDSKYTEDLLKQIDTSNITIFNNYLTSCSARPLAALMDFSSALDCTGCFKSNTDTSLYPDLILPKATILKEFLRQNTGLTTVNKIDAPVAIDGSYMFYGCSALTNIKDINMPELIDGSYMFYQTALTQEMVQKMNSTKLENASYMYAYNTGITSMSINNEVVNCASTLKNASYALRNMTNLSTLTISNLTFNELTTAEYLCYGLSKRATINFTNLTLPKLTKLDYAFSSPSNGVTVNFTNVNAPELTSMNRLLSSCSTSATLNFTDCSWPKLSGTNAYIGTGFTSNDSNYVSSLSMNLSGFDFSGTTDASNMFSGWYAGTMRMENKDLSHITTAANMFYSGASSLSSSSYRRSSRNIYMKNVNFSGLTNMDYFFGAGFYKTIDLSGCDFSNVDSFKSFIVQTPYAMNNSSTAEVNFSNIKLKPGADTTGFYSGGLTYSLNLTGWTDPAQIKPVASNNGSGTLSIPDVDWTGWTDMSDFFHGGTINGNWNNLEGVTSYYNAFNTINNISQIATQLSFDSAVNCSKMFYMGRQSGTLDLSDKNMDNVTDMSYMFYRNNFQTVILPDNLPKVETIYYMFEYQPNKNTELILPKYMPSLKNAAHFCDYNAKIPKVTMPEVSQIEDLQSAFEDCTSLTEIVNLDTSKCTNLNSAFYNCSSLVESPVIDVSCLTQLQYTFKNCSSLTKITFVGDPSNITTFSDPFMNVAPEGTFVYDYRYNYSNVIANLPSGWNAVPNVTISEYTALEIDVENARWSQTKAPLTYIVTAKGIDANGVQLDSIMFSGSGYSSTFEKNDTKEDVTREVTFEYGGLTATATIIHLAKPDKNFECILNDEWRESSMENPNPAIYEGVYESFAHYGTYNSGDVMYIDIEGYTTFKLYMRSITDDSIGNAVMVSQLDQAIDGTTAAGASSVYASTYNRYPASGEGIGKYTLVTFSGIDGGKHRITICYRNFSSSWADETARGYIVVPINQ